MESSTKVLQASNTGQPKQRNSYLEAMAGANF